MALRDVVGPAYPAGTYTFTVSELVVGERAGDAVAMLVTVYDAGGADVTAPTLNPVAIVNLPSYVPDPEGTDLVLEDGRTFRLDPEAALVETLTALVQSPVATRS